MIRRPPRATRCPDTTPGRSVTATGGDYAAGIGGGYYYGAGGEVTISGGTVTATGGDYAAGIGGGSGASSGGAFSTGQSGNAVIFASGSSETNHIQAAEDSSNPWNGVIFQGNEGQVYGTSVTPAEDFTIPRGKTLTIGGTQTLTIQTGVTLTVEQGGTVTNNGTINNYGTVDTTSSGTVTNNGTFLVYGTLNGTVAGSGTVAYKVTGVSLNQNTLNLTVGGTATLTATVQPSNATNQNVTWASGNSSVATVDSGGTVTAVGAGTATITVTTADGGYIASCAVTVTQPDNGDPSYSVSWPKQVEGGRVTVKKSYAEEGETFSFTVTPDAGWELASLSVTDGAGRAIPVTDEGGGEYSFEMPAARVSFDVSFRPVQAALPFADVDESYWARDEIAWAYENGYMSGTSAVSFNPGGTVSRQQVWMILARMAGENPADMAAAKAWAVASGISDGTNPGGAVTRQQLAALLYRYAVQNGMAAVTMEENLSGYPDAANVSGYAVQALNWAVGQGILGGMADGTLNPGGTASRAQLAVMLCRWQA